MDNLKGILSLEEGDAEETKGTRRKDGPIRIWRRQVLRIPITVAQREEKEAGQKWSWTSFWSAKEMERTSCESL